MKRRAEAVNIKVSDEEGGFVFEGNVSTDVEVHELLHWFCSSGKHFGSLRYKETMRRVKSLKGLHNVEVIAYRGGCLDKFSGFLFDHGVGKCLRSKSEPPLLLSSECITLAAWRLPHAECCKVFTCGNLEDLKFSLCELTEVPKEIVKLKKLKKLKLDRLKDLESISDEIRQLSCLEELVIDFCKTIRLPSGIIGCKQLEKLLLNNSIGSETLLEEVGQLSSLKELTIHFCKIERLPNVSGLKLLERLSLTYLLALKCLPEGFDELQNLKELTIESCGIGIVSFNGLERLEKLSLSLPQLAHISEDVGALLNLKELEIEWCGLRELPREIGRLKQLEKLKLVGLGDLKIVPEEIGNLLNLKSLWLWTCDGIECLPSSIGRLKQLEDLTLSHLRNLHSIPDELGSLFRLKNLRIVACGISCLPKSIGKLSTLEMLSLSYLENLKSIPEEIGQLAALEKLHVINCGTAELPKGLKYLNSLSTLCLLQVQLSPEDVAVFSRLVELRLDSCSFKTHSSLEAFCNMLAMATRLRSVEFAFDTQEQMVIIRSALECNGSIIIETEGSVVPGHIIERNCRNFHSATSSVLCLLAIRRWKLGLGDVQREMVDLIARMLWTTRCDLEAGWSRK